VPKGSNGGLGCVLRRPLGPKPPPPVVADRFNGRSLPEPNSAPFGIILIFGSLGPNSFGFWEDSVFDFCRCKDYAAPCKRRGGSSWRPFEYF